MLNATYENQSLTRERLWDRVVIQQFSTAAREHAINGEAGHVVSYIEAFKSASTTETISWLEPLCICLPEEVNVIYKLFPEPT